ncbi:autotransporter domain-containing protein, partial [Variovorax sp. KK3]
AGALNTLGNGALGNASAIDIAAGAALRLGGNASAGGLTGAGALDVGVGSVLTLGGTNADSTFAGALNGAGSLAKAGSGTLVLNGGGTVAGTSVDAGRLLIGDASNPAAVLNGPITVASGATLGGTGTAGNSVTVNAGGVLAPGDGIGNLRVGALTLAQGSVLEIGLGAASGSPTVQGVSDSITVAGDLTLDGATLNLVDVGGYGPGLYRLFDYGGTLSLGNGGLVLGATPGGTPIVQYLSGAKQINLVNAAGLTLAMWNANGAASATQMGGGTGTWSTTSPVWTDAIGSVTGAMQPMPGFAIFGGTPGVVTVDNTAGAVNATGLQFAVDGYLVDGAPLTLVSSSATPIPVINVGDGSAASAGYVATIDAPLAGSAGFDKIGAGTLVLGGANTYTGNTVLSGGTLSIASDAALGAPANGIDFNGGALRVTGTADTGTARTAVLGAAGGTIDIADPAGRFDMSQPIGGSGALVKAGTGTLVLSADSNFGGGTTIAAGTLQLGNGGTGGSITGNVTNNGVLAFDRSDALSVGGTISGSGSVSQIGTGSTTLGASNGYTGGTLVSAGTLVGSSGSFGSGPITDNAALVLAQGVDGTLANVIAGTGSFTKTGAGNLTLTAASGGFAGTTAVDAGTLTVQGVLGGTLGVGSGATLAGIGTVGSTTVAGGGTVSPAGSGIGTLNVNGNLVLAPGSTLLYDASTLAGDRIAVSGTATLQGPTLALNANGTWNLGASYSVVDAAGGLTGTFGSVRSNFAFLTPNLSYGPTSASITLTRNDVGFSQVGTTPNQIAAGAAADSLPAGSPLYGAVVQLDAPSARLAFDQLAGDTHANSRTAMLEGSHFTRDAAIDALRQSEGESVAAPDASASRGDRNLWLRSFGSWGHTRADGNSARTNTSLGGVLIGADMPVGGGWRAGVYGGYSQGKYEADSRRARVEDDAYHLGVYGGTRWDRLALRLGASYTRHKLESQRTVVFPGLVDSLRADQRARTAQVFGELGWRIDAGRVALEPFANLAYVDLRSKGFAERGGAAALRSRGDSKDLTFSTLGLRASTLVSAGAADITLRGMVGWRHAFGDVVPTSTLALAGGNDFQVGGLPVARNALVVEAGMDMAVARNLRVGIGYAGQAGGGRRDHGLKANLLWKF